MTGHIDLMVWCSETETIVSDMLEIAMLKVNKNEKALMMRLSLVLRCVSRSEPNPIEARQPSDVAAACSAVRSHGQ